MEVVSSTGRGREEDKQRRAEHGIFQAEAAKGYILSWLL
jgi:hypothetical protein